MAHACGAMRRRAGLFGVLWLAVRPIGAARAADVFAERFESDAAPAPSAEAALALAPGWHAFELRWTDGTMTAAVDGKETMQLAVPSLNLPEATGAGLLTQARFVFGGPRAALDAIDEVSAWRK
jgi:hypothetical protein